MKILLSLIACFYVASAHADACGNLSDYQVTQTAFTRLPVDEAVTRITKGTPFQIIMAGESDTQITASSISGDLDIVLNELAKTSNFTYVKEKCVIRITPKIKGRTWVVRNGDDLKTTLTDWGRAAGWQVVFDEQDMRYGIGADMETSGSIEEAVTILFETINKNARSLHANFHYGNKVLQISNSSPAINEGERLSQ